MQEDILKPLNLYQYTPIHPHQIRLLKLHPGELDSAVAVSLKECTFYTAQQGFYEALSYVWGDSNRQDAIECNGAILKITGSLHNALIRIRYPKEYRLLWVDAICINQDDYEEREYQVSLMKDIYSWADNVLIWLGETDGTVKLAVKAIDEWATFNRQYRQSSDATRFSKFEERFAYTPGYRDSLKAVGALTFRPWFNRCWTFQEIILSTKARLFVDKYQISWDCFYHALEAFPLHLIVDDILNFNALFMCHGKARLRSNPRSFSDSIFLSRDLSRILQMTRNLDTSDPRDKIFSLLSIATIKNPITFRPNYSRSVQGTYLSLSIAMIHNEGNLNVLVGSGEQNRDKSLPSWCPDWSGKRGGVNLSGYYDCTSYNINADAKLDLSRLHMSELNELELDGAFIDVVEKVYDLEVLRNDLRASSENYSFTDVLSSFADAIGLQNCLLHDQLSAEAVLLRTLSADHWYFSAHLNSSYKEHWFPTHLRFRDLKRNMNAHLDGVSVTIGALIKCQKLSMQYRSKIKKDPPLDITRMGSLYLYKDAIANIKSQRGYSKDDLENPFTHSVIDKVYKQTSPFYEEGQSFEAAKKIDNLTLTAIAREAISQAIFFFKGKKILISKRGFVAIGQGSAKVGDFLCSFWGVDVPFVIRKKKRSAPNDLNIKQNHIKRCSSLDETFKMIGECYIDGIMYGELYKNSNRASEPAKNFQPGVDWVQIRRFRIS